MATLFNIENPAIPESEKKRVYEILAQHSCAVSRGPHDLGHLNGVEHSIDTKNERPMDLSPIRQNFEKIQNRQKFHNSLKEHPMFSKIAKFGCEMLETVENIALRS